MSVPPSWRTTGVTSIHAQGEDYFVRKQRSSAFLDRFQKAPQFLWQVGQVGVTRLR